MSSDDDITSRVQGTLSDTEIEPHLSSVREGPSPENILEVNSPTDQNSNDTRYNRGKPPTRYSLNVEERRSKYPIANYVSTKRLSGLLKTFAHELSSCHVPISVQKALTDPKWTIQRKKWRHY